MNDPQFQAQLQAAMMTRFNGFDLRLSSITLGRSTSVYVPIIPGSWALDAGGGRLQVAPCAPEWVIAIPVYLVDAATQRKGKIRVADSPTGTYQVVNVDYEDVASLLLAMIPISLERPKWVAPHVASDADAELAVRYYYVPNQNR